MILIKNGVAEELAWAMRPSERLARVVVFGELEGNEFDWEAMRFKERK